MKHIAPVRKALGIRTVFNVLGPLVNPAEPPFHVIGAASEKLAGLMAETLSAMPIRRAFVVYGAAGWDEATPIGPFICFDVRPGVVERALRDPASCGIARCSESDLAGGEPEDNAARLRAALEGGDTTAHRDALVIGAALALEVSGSAPDFAAGIVRAQQAIASGAARELLARIDAFAEAEKSGASR
jgi:anthranilate phosphoribosyltransferase